MVSTRMGSDGSLCTVNLPTPKPGMMRPSSATPGGIEIFLNGEWQDAGVCNIGTTISSGTVGTSFAAGSVTGPVLTPSAGRSALQGGKKKYKFMWKDVIFDHLMDEGEAALFDNMAKATKDEMLLYQMTYPVEYETLRSSWVKARMTRDLENEFLS